MKRNILLTLATLAGAAAYVLASGPHSSAAYTLQPAVLDGGGVRAVSANYTHDGSVLDIEGTSAAGPYAAGHGFIAQLTGACLTFEVWQILHFGSAAHPDASPKADPDNDGVTNMAEFAFNLNPLQPDASTLTTGGSTGLPRYNIEVVNERERLTVTFVRRAGCGRYVVESSSDLSTWTETLTIPMEGPVPLPGGWELFKLADEAPVSTEARRFLRVAVEF
jgi:hypothetical protein